MVLAWHLVPLVCLHASIECLTGGKAPSWLPLVSLLIAVATAEKPAPLPRALSVLGWARVLLVGGLLGAAPPGLAAYVGIQAAATRSMWPPRALEAVGCAVSRELAHHPAVPLLAARLWPLALLACTDRTEHSRQVRVLSLLALAAR
jgi:hypothetical protein